MHGVNLLLICMVPPYYKNRGGVSTISGLLNSCTYIGSSISTYGIAAIADRFGWHTTVFMWIIIAAAGSIVCFACVRPWKKFILWQYSFVYEFIKSEICPVVHYAKAYVTAGFFWRFFIFIPLIKGCEWLFNPQELKMYIENGFCKLKN